MKKIELNKKDQDLLKILLSNAFLQTYEGRKNAHEVFMEDNQSLGEEGGFFFGYCIKEIEQFEIWAKITERDPKRENGQAIMQLAISDLSGKEWECKYLVDEFGDVHIDEGITNHPLYLFLKSQHEKEQIQAELGAILASDDATQSGRRKGRL